ncbi:hypothetical protein PR048_008702 [Dryococelus australis]|uniref:Uncharacterized protein n=1 Tax=Dryococelus australis TaxID=614101 RepID=A0ABQ9HXW0_9NEOP|nr:hypothetical protein PR048_008702 [Dryococelus australis]
MNANHVIFNGATGGIRKIEWPALLRAQLEVGELPQAVFLGFDDSSITGDQPSVGVCIEPSTDECEARLSGVCFLSYCAVRHDGNTERLARRSDEALGVRVSVAHIAPTLLDLRRGKGAIPLLRIPPNSCLEHLTSNTCRDSSWWDRFLIAAQHQSPSSGTVSGIAVCGCTYPMKFTNEEKLGALLIYEMPSKPPNCLLKSILIGRPSHGKRYEEFAHISCHEGIGIPQHECDERLLKDVHNKPYKTGNAMTGAILARYTGRYGGPCSFSESGIVTWWGEGAAVAEWLACSPPAKANRMQSPTGLFPDFRKWESCRTMPLVSGFSRGYSIYPRPLSFRRFSILTSITAIGSQDLDFKILPNLFSHSLRLAPTGDYHSVIAWSGEIWAAHNFEVLEADEGEVSGAGMHGRAKWDITEKARPISGIVRHAPPRIEPGSPWWRRITCNTRVITRHQAKLRSTVFAGAGVVSPLAAAWMRSHALLTELHVLGVHSVCAPRMPRQVTILTTTPSSHHLHPLRAVFEALEKLMRFLLRPIAAIPKSKRGEIGLGDKRENKGGQKECEKTPRDRTRETREKIKENGRNMRKPQDIERARERDRRE